MAYETIVTGIGTAQSYVYTLAVGIVILLVGFGIGILVKKVSLRFLAKIELNKILFKAGITKDVEKIASSLLAYFIYIFTLILFLEQFEIKSIWVLWLIVGAVLLLTILTILVGLKDVIPNFIGWIYIQKKGKIQEGRKVDINEIYGLVEKVGYLETEIKTDKGDLLYVPNALFLRSKHRIKD